MIFCKRFISIEISKNKEKLIMLYGLSNCMGKRRIAVILLIITVISIIAIAGILIYYNNPSTDNITVSGKASSAALSQPFPTSIQRIEFADTQTGIVTTFHFPFTPQSNNSAGNYSVYLKNEHTYNVFISYYHGIPPNMESESDYFTTFTVHAPAGEKTITKNFC